MKPGDPVWLRHADGRHVLDVEGLPVAFEITAVDALATSTWYRLTTDHPTANEIFSAGTPATASALFRGGAPRPPARAANDGRETTSSAVTSPSTAALGTRYCGSTTGR